MDEPTLRTLTGEGQLRALSRIPMGELSAAAKCCSHWTAESRFTHNPKNRIHEKAIVFTVPSSITRGSTSGVVEAFALKDAHRLVIQERRAESLARLPFASGLPLPN